MNNSGSKHKHKIARRCLAMMIAITSFISLAFPDYGILPKAGAMDETALLPLAATGANTGLLARFDFEGGTKPEDKSGNNVAATLVNPASDTVISTEGNNSYLDLTSSDAYLSLPGNLFNGLTEMTVEMRVKTNDVTGPNWAFFAAPNANSPTDWGLEHYLGILLKNSVTVERYANSGNRPVNPVITGWTANEWHIIRVVFKTKSTYLCIDNKTEVEIGTAYSLKDCIGENGVLWFGHASWGSGEGFNGCIDDIRIWDHAVFDPVTDEEKYIITDRVVDPKYTTVNMFDYWITAQGDNDYATLDGTDHNTLLNGINEGHLFLFAGETAFSGGPLAQATADEIGAWNRSTGSLGNNGELVTTNEITQGIVQNTLTSDGYPALALDKFAAPTNGILRGLWTDSAKRNESLGYLFDLTTGLSKAVYPNVTGLFRINDKGYYEFRSWNTFAELNVEQGTSLKTSTGNNHITLYDKIWGWGLPHEHDGQFFPFNDWSDMFYADPLTGEPVQAYKNDTVNIIEGGSGQTATDEPLNHYFGMTVETEFRQPTDGIIESGSKKEPMKFEFSGDDDIWIFIDGVLVGDLGGIHGWKTITIDFSTGAVKISNDKEGKKDFTHETTLYQMFNDAGQGSSAVWKNNTFADNSTHTLKFFYLERGNQFSNCNITFNLQEPIADHIRKVDENGDPLAGAEFELYAATGTINENEWWRHTSKEFRKASNTPIITTVSNGMGYASLTDAKGDPLDLSTLSASGYYILEETGTPAGYRQNPPIVLRYHSDTKTLTVVNKYEVGAYASFLADWAQQPGNAVNFTSFDRTTGTFAPTGAADPDELKKGLSVIVPIGKIDGQWLPVYGSNTYGWSTVTSNDDFVKALATAAIMQLSDPNAQEWYLRWDDSEGRLKGHIENLPGDATRYSAGGDIKLATLFLPESALTALGLNTTAYTNDGARYAALKNLLRGSDKATAETRAAALSGLGLLYTEDFVKTNRTVIYVPNEQRELRVRKVNEKDVPIAGAVFALFDDLNNAVGGDITTSVAYGRTGGNGELIFSTNASTAGRSGHAKMDWDSAGTNAATAVYWLKEITAPSGYKLNKSIIRIEVGNAGIYANATGFDADNNPITGDDGVKVEASLGKLTQTLVKYAEGIVDETLTHITATEQTAGAPDGSLDISSWLDVSGASENLTYKANGYDPVMTYTAEDGYVRIMPRQTDGITNTTAKRDDLTGIDLNGLFSTVNTVIVTDKTLPGTEYVPGSQIKPTEPNESSEPDDPSEPDDVSESNAPSEPNSSDELNTSDNNPHTGFDARSIFWVTVLTLSLTAAVYPQSKRGKHRK